MSETPKTDPLLVARSAIAADNLLELQAVSLLAQLERERTFSLFQQLLKLLNRRMSLALEALAIIAAGCAGNAPAAAHMPDARPALEHVLEGQAGAPAQLAELDAGTAPAARDAAPELDAGTAPAARDAAPELDAGTSPAARDAAPELDAGDAAPELDAATPCPASLCPGVYTFCACVDAGPSSCTGTLYASKCANGCTSVCATGATVADLVCCSARPDLQPKCECAP